MQPGRTIPKKFLDVAFPSGSADHQPTKMISECGLSGLCRLPDHEVFAGADENRCSRHILKVGIRRLELNRCAV